MGKVTRLRPPGTPDAIRLAFGPEQARRSLLPVIRRFCPPAGRSVMIDEDPRRWTAGWKMEDAEALRPLALERARRIPDCARLHRLRMMFAAVLRGETEPELTRALICKMLSVMPAARAQSPGAYVEAALAILGEVDFEHVDSEHYAGYSPPIVAAAARTILREMTFTPSIAELVESCRAARAAFRGAERDAAMLLRLRAEADMVLVELDLLSEDGSILGDEPAKEDDDDIIPW